MAPPLEARGPLCFPEFARPFYEAGIIQIRRDHPIAVAFVGMHDRLKDTLGPRAFLVERGELRRCFLPCLPIQLCGLSIDFFAPLQRGDLLLLLR